VKYDNLLRNESLFFEVIWCSAKMSVAKANKRKYKEDYIRYGVACLHKDGAYIPQGYVVHENTGCLKSFQLKQHLNKAHKEQPSKID